MKKQRLWKKLYVNKCESLYTMDKFVIKHCHKTDTKRQKLKISVKEIIVNFTHLPKTFKVQITSVINCTKYLLLLLFSRWVMSNSLWPPWTVAARLLCPRDFPGKNTGVGYHLLLQRIFLIQGLNPHFLHWQEGSLPLSH